MRHGAAFLGVRRSCRRFYALSPAAAASDNARPRTREAQPIRQTPLSGGSLRLAGVRFFVYILRGERTGHLYTGYTKNVTQRLGQHSEGLTKSTKNRGPWKLVHPEEFATRAEAMRREKFLKSGQGFDDRRGVVCSASLLVSACENERRRRATALFFPPLQNRPIKTTIPCSCQKLEARI
jgi:putative endonuclease